MKRPSQYRQASIFGLRVSFGIRASGFGFPRLLCGAAIALASQPVSLWACAACAGQSDSPLAKGMNWGIYSLLAVIVMVLAGVASFFVYLARKAAAVAAASVQPNSGRARVPASPNFSGTLRPSGLAGTLALPNRPHPLLEFTNTA